jgi:hypothetical protein
LLLAKNRDYTANPVVGVIACGVEKLKIRESEIASGCDISDLLGSQDIFYPTEFTHLERKVSLPPNGFRTFESQ